jgi:LysM repeat protein
MEALCGVKGTNAKQRGAIFIVKASTMFNQAPGGSMTRALPRPKHSPVAEGKMKALRLWLVLGLVSVSLGWAAPAHAQDQVVHVVQPGQNLFRIALQYGTTVDAIMAANGLTNPQLIYSGQRLVIPRGSGGSAPSAGGVYTVQWGDTLSRIALRHSVTVWALAQANGISIYQTIYAGQRLVIPGGGATPAPATPATLRAEPQGEAGDTYVVRPGDTLNQIAQRFGTTVSALARLNGIANPSAIYPGQVLRLSGAAPTPASDGAKHIIVDLSEQHLYAYQGDQLVYSFVASSGAAPNYTRIGEFRVQSKIPNAYGSAWSIWMPNWLGIYWAGSTENGIHALPILSNGQRLWAGYLGTPISYGCIVLGVREAELLYNWTEIGTAVTIRY